MIYKVSEIKVSKKAISCIKNIEVDGEQKMLVSSRDGNVYLLKKDRIKSIVANDEKRITCIDYSKNGDLVISTTASNKIDINDINNGAVIKSKKLGSLQKCVLNSVSLNSDNNKIVVGDKNLYLLNTELEVIDTIKYNSIINHCQFVPGTNQIVVASDDGAIRIWDASDKLEFQRKIFGETIFETDEDDEINYANSVKAMAFSKDGSLLAYGTRDGKVHLVNLIKNVFLRTMNVGSQIRALAYSDNQPIIAITVPNKVLFWNILNPKVDNEYIFSSKKNECYCDAISFVGNSLLIGLDDGSLITLENNK